MPKKPDPPPAPPPPRSRPDNEGTLMAIFFVALGVMLFGWMVWGAWLVWW